MSLRTSVLGPPSRMIFSMPGIEYLSADNPAAFTEIWYEIADDQHFWVRWRFSVLLEEIGRLGLDPRASLSGLDIGCGHGVMLRKLSNATCWLVDGCDLNKAALSFSAGHSGRVLFYNVHDRRPELANKYDFILLFDVVEHVEEAPRFIAAAAYHLKPGGLAFVNVPALQGLYSKYDAVQGHHRRYNKALLHHHLARGGLEVCSMRYWGMTMVPVAFVRKFYVNTMSEPSEIIRSGFQTRGRLGRLLLTAIEFVEQKWLRYRPLGTSLFAVARKPRLPTEMHHAP